MKLRYIDFGLVTKEEIQLNNKMWVAPNFWVDDPSNPLLFRVTPDNTFFILRVSDLENIPNYVTTTDNVVIVQNSKGPKDLLYCWSAGGSAFGFSFKKGTLFEVNEKKFVINSYFNALIKTFPGTYRSEWIERSEGVSGTASDLCFNGRKLLGVAIHPYSYLSFVNVTMDNIAFNNIINLEYALANVNCLKEPSSFIGLDEIYPDIKTDDFAFRFATNLADELKLEGVVRSEQTETEKAKFVMSPPKAFDFSTFSKDDLRTYIIKEVPVEKFSIEYSWSQFITSEKFVAPKK